MLTAAARPRRRLVTSSTESHSLNYCDYYTVFNFYCKLQTALSDSVSRD